MALTSPARPAKASGPDLGYAYLMTGAAIVSICISGVFGSIFTPDLVSTSGTATGYTRQHVPLAAYMGWIFAVAALAMLLPTAMRGIRARLTDRVAWTVLGVGTAGIWLAVMFVSIFAPALRTGTAPWLTWVPLGSMLAAIAGLILTWFLCRFVKSAFFEQGGDVKPPAGTTTAGPGPEPAAEDAATKLRQLAQLRDSGVITEGEFQAKKDDLLSRM